MHMNEWVVFVGLGYFFIGGKNGDLHINLFCTIGQ